MKNIRPVFYTIFLVTICSFTVRAQESMWRYETGGRVYSSPAIAGDKLLIGSGDSCLYALNKYDGSLIWKYRTNGPVHSTPEVSNSNVYFSSTDGSLYAVDINTGSLSWRFLSNGERSRDIWDYYISSPKLSNGLVFWGSADSCMYALNEANGKQKWSFKAEDIIHATPAIAGDTLFIGDFNGNLYALNTEEGKLLWSFRTIGDRYFPKGEIQKGISADRDAIYFGSRDYNIYSIDRKSGRALWNLKEGSWVISTPTFHNNMLFYGTSDTHEFVSLDKLSGKVLWRVPLPMRVYGSAVVNNEIVYFGCFDGILRGVDIISGEIQYRFRTAGSIENYSRVFDSNGKFHPDFQLYGRDYLESEKAIHALGSILSTPLVDGDKIYFGSSDGGVYCIDLTKVCEGQ